MICFGVKIYADNEGTLTATLRIKNGNFDLTRTVQNYQFNQTTSASDYGILTTTLATNRVPTVNVTTPRYAFFRNLGTNRDVYVTVTMRLQPGDVAVMPLADTNIQCYATNAPPSLEYWVNQQ